MDDINRAPRNHSWGGIYWDFASPIAAGWFPTDESRDHTVKIDVSGLSSGATYYYRFNFTATRAAGQMLQLQEVRRWPQMFAARTCMVSART